MSSSPHILIVDDNQDSCDLLKFMLEQSDNNYQVTSALTAERAISIINNQTFDLYILDYHLPEMSGIELCRHLRMNDEETPIMFFSAMAHQMNKDKGIGAGANEYLVKPNDLANVTETVKNLLKLKTSTVLQTDAYNKDSIW